MKRLGMRILALASAGLVGFLIVEVLLRAFPSLISVPALGEFPDELSATVAERVHLPTKRTAVVIKSADRTDKGRPFDLLPPLKFVRDPGDRIDRTVGAVDGIVTDRNGFCNEPKWNERGRADVVVVGDSFVFCTGVGANQTSAAQLEAQTGLWSYNLGVQGIGPSEYLELLKRFGFGFKPKVVVLNVYEGNDLRDLILNEAFLKDPPADKPAPPPADAGSWLNYSYAGSFLRGSVRLLTEQIRGFPINFRYTARSEGRTIDLNVTNADVDEVTHARLLLGGEISLAAFEPSLREFASLAKKHGFVPIVSYAPSMYSAYADTVVFSDPAVGRDVLQFGSLQRKWLREACKDLGLVFVDTTPALRQAAVSGPLTHFPSNTHLTARGHAVVAQELAAAIRR